MSLKKDEADELQGANPPLNLDEEMSQNESTVSHNTESSNIRFEWLKQWGPYKRWIRYKEMNSFYREAQKLRKSDDAEENEAGKLDDNESVQIPGVWVIELYTPSTVDGLLSGIKKLGWETGRFRNSDLIKWMSDVREGRKSGWINLGLVSPTDAVHMMSERNASLPTGVTGALPVLISITPSLTAFIILFLFDEETARSIEKPLRTYFPTHIEREYSAQPWHIFKYVFTNNSKGIERKISSPDMVRRDIVKSSIKKIELSCVDWLKERFPGSFTSLPCSQPAPTAMILLTNQIKPLTEEARRVKAFKGLAINRSYDSWESNEWPAARLVLPRGWDDEGKRLTFSCRRKDAFEPTEGYHEPTSNWTIAQRSNELIQGLLTRWAITCLLDSYHETLAILRHQVAGDGSYRAIRDLKELRKLARTTFYDIGACTTEIEEFTKSDSYFRDVIKMSYTARRKESQPDLLENLLKGQIKRLQQVQKEVALLSSTLATSNNITQTISNIMIQRIIVALTIISTCIALWALLK